MTFNELIEHVGSKTGNGEGRRGEDRRRSISTFVEAAASGGEGTVLIGYGPVQGESTAGASGPQSINRRTA
jgi:hypothetical protein